MLPKGQDWARLCRAYRQRHGLKQEAMAQDFLVDQSTVSRWERGLREPSLPMKQAILNDMLDSGQAGLGQAMGLMLEQSGSAVAIWARDCALLGASPRFEREALGGVDGAPSLLSRPLVLQHVVGELDKHGFFDGKVMLAILRVNPFLQDRRAKAGGVVVVSMFPFRTPQGDIAALAVHDHDVFAEPLETSGTMMISFMGGADGHLDSSLTVLPGF